MRMFFTTRTGMTLDGAPVKDHRRRLRSETSQDMQDRLREVNRKNAEFWDRINKEPEGEQKS